MDERRLALPPAEAPEPALTRMLQIVVEDSPAPLGALIEVLPAVDAPRKVVLPERLPPEPMAPVRRDSGLVRVQAVEPEPDEAPPPPAVVRKPETMAVAKAVAPSRALATKTVAPKTVASKAVAPKAVAPKALDAKVLAPKPLAPKALATKAVAPKALAPKALAPKVLKAATPKTKAKPAKLEKVGIEKAKVKSPTTKVAKAAVIPTKDRVRLAKVDRRDKPAWIEKPARVEKAELKKPNKLNGGAHEAARAAPRKAEPAPTPKVQKTRVEPKKLEPKKTQAPKPRAEKAVVQAKPIKVAPPMAIRPAKGAGPVRVAKAAPRPDSAIRDADRQMDRAYTTARAAGVPDWQLRRQQQRWAQTRASAAREAPWAVHDVYLARIAELHDLTRHAQGTGY